MKVRTVATSSPSGRTRFIMTLYICAIACCSWQQVVFLQPEAFVNRRRLWSEFLVSCCLNCLPRNAPLLFVGLFEGVFSQIVGMRVGFRDSRSGQTLEGCMQTGLKVKPMTATTIYTYVYSALFRTDTVCRSSQLYFFQEPCVNCQFQLQLFYFSSQIKEWLTAHNRLRSKTRKLWFWTNEVLEFWWSH